MPSLDIAPYPKGLRQVPLDPAAGAAPVTGVFPAGVESHLLEIRLQAIQLFPYHAGPPTRRPIRLGTTADFLACYFPRIAFRLRVSHQTQGYLLQSLPTLWGI